VSETPTIRERIEHAAGYISHKEGVVLTTFNFNADFLEEQVLPVVLGVEAETSAARQAEVHQRLGGTPCTLYYDPSIASHLSGRYRYEARPVPMRGRFFHPKLVIIAGQSQEGVIWVYLAVSSANLTLSGWGRNVESFGETWIHTKRQQTHKALDRFLHQLASMCPLGEVPNKHSAVTRVRAVLDRMPETYRFRDDGSQPWSGKLHAKFYSSLVNKKGFPDFMRNHGWSQGISELWVYSPYWGEVSEQVKHFGAKKTVLIPALLGNGKLGLSRAQRDELKDNEEIRQASGEAGDRFRHAKAYWMKFRSRFCTAVGSCNFTHAGLAGVAGNVEAMLVFDGLEPDWPDDDLLVDVDALADDSVPEEDIPEALPIAIVVGFDWHSMTWCWWLSKDLDQNYKGFSLQLPGLEAFDIEPGSGKKSGKPPPRGELFTIYYQSNKGAEQWKGQVVELNLDFSTRRYGRPLSANEILDSWRGRAPTWDLGGGGGQGDGEGEEDGGQGEAAFDAVNLYDFYRSIRALRIKLSRLDQQPEVQRSLLVGRPDSVIALALLADSNTETPAVRYLVLRELRGIISRWENLLDKELSRRLDDICSRARSQTHDLMLKEVGQEQGRTTEMLDWFESRLNELDGATP
jgi:hypothetical protein